MLGVVGEGRSIGDGHDTSAPTDVWMKGPLMFHATGSEVFKLVSISQPGGSSSRLPVIRRCMVRISSPLRSRMRNLPRRRTPSISRSAISARKSGSSGWPIVRSQKTRTSRIVAPMIASRSWRAVCSTSGNSGISSLSTFTQPRSRGGAGHLQ